MSLTEPQIRRFARHILLPEVGGIGQERLLDARVLLRGVPELTDLARSYLEAAGTPCTIERGVGLRLSVESGERPIGDVTLQAAGDSIVIRVGGAPTSSSELDSHAVARGMIAASLAASEAQRLILGMGDASRAWRVADHGITRVVE